MNRPIIGITMGDPSGNGPELSVKALMKQETYERCRPVIIGDAKCIEAAIQTIEGAEGMKVRALSSVSDALFECGTIDVYDMDLVDLNKRYFRKDRAALSEKLPADEVAALYEESQKMCGNAAFQYVKKVIELAMAGEVDATVTNALNKYNMNLAGHHFNGHTEVYAHFTNTKKYTMMLAHEELRVVHVSTHVSLRQACDLVKKDRVLDVIRIANEGCKALGIEKPKIGVAGLNPHCGENGMFGTEEIEEIQPAIDAAMAEGICIPEKAPTPPDTVFSKALGGWYDIVVVMYHDQGHIPLKVKGFVYNKALQKWDAVAGVNVTLGLPIIRASVDHGTGEDIAGLGISSEISLVNAMDYAIRMANAKK
ncbi:MAG: 4-hydroxythreonine-4-phosphate dehydrogenase PdxA [Lachnospiraceae bacterium]|nr:4-hydroxythreonine-4-phosphate dehydrogenase PdxA [Lachnospiraceae bacterium]